jgi:hypothetical protein
MSTDDGWNATVAATYVGLTRVLCRLPADSPYRFNVSLPAAADVVTPISVLFAFSPYANTTIQRTVTVFTPNLTVRVPSVTVLSLANRPWRAGDRLLPPADQRHVQRDLCPGAGGRHGDQQ